MRVKEREKKSEWEGGRVVEEVCVCGGGEGGVVGGGVVLAQCDIQSGDESQHKKLKAAAEISRLISIQIRHKFYMPDV